MQQFYRLGYPFIPEINPDPMRPIAPRCPGQVPIPCREAGQGLTPQRIRPAAMEAHHHHIDFRRAVDMARLPTARGDGAATPERGL